MSPTHTRRFLTSSLIAGVSALALASPALGREVLFASDPAIGQAASSGERVTQQGGLTQVRLDNGGTASFVDGASFQVRADGSVDLFSGSVTVAGGDNGAVVVHLANEGEGTVRGAGSAASFSVDLREGKTPEIRGHVLNGTALVSFGTGNPRTFGTGEMWRSDGGNARLAVANGAASVPDAAGSGQPQVEDMGPGEASGGLVAAANNGVPVVLGDALAAAGASGDIVAAARRVQAASANPSIETYPSGDLALLVGYAGRLSGAYGGTPFNGAAADIIRTYLQFLAGGGSQANFLTSYVGFTLQFLDLMRAGALPSSFRGSSLAQINSFISYRGRTVGFGSFSAQNKVLIDNYLAFILGGGNADQFLVRYTDLTASYFTFLRGGGTPAAFTGASQTTITAYLTFLRDAGLLGQLTAQNQSLLTAYLQSLTANGSGLAFADQYRLSLNSYYLFLQQGRLPSTYTAADLAALRTYLESLKATGLFDVTLGTQASFFNGYLVYLQGGGTVDGYGQLPANIFASYTLQLNAYYAFLRDGGLPSAYTVLTQAQISAYLSALQNAGATTRYLGDLSTFWTNYFAWYAGNNNPDLFAGLPAVNYPAFASALNTYYAYLAGGGLPSGYTALTQAQLQQYINALIAAGRSNELLGGNASFLTAYFAYLTGGGVANNYSGLPIYATYTSALNAYYIYLQGGGVPSGYTLLTAAQIQAYLQALVSAGVFNTLVTGDAQTFLTSYYAYITGGGTPNGYSMLPVYTSYTTALNAYYAYLAGGGLPSGYTALTSAQIQAYLQALINAGVFNTLFTGSSQTFLTAYYTYLNGGGTPNGYSGLPIYTSYTASLNAYYIYLQGGGLPSGYTVLTLAQLQAYLQALINAGVFNTLFTGSSASFFEGYYTYVSGGGTANSYSGLATINGGSAPILAIGVSGNYSVSIASSGLYAGGPADPGVGAVPFDAQGKPTSIGFFGAPGTATLRELNSGTGFVVGRFGGGTFGSGVNQKTYAANDGAHFAMLTPTTAIPTTGTVSYTVVGQTTPTVPGGASTFTGAGLNLTLGVTFDSAPKFGYRGSISGALNGQAVSLFVASPGGALAPSLTNVFLSQGALSLYGGTSALSSATGPICTGTQSCSFAANFISGGAGASMFALGYGIIDNANSTSILNGAAVLGNPTAAAGGGGATTTKTYSNQTFATVFNGSNLTADPTTIVATPDGKLTSWVTSGGSLIQRGTNTDYDSGGIDGVIGWTRWAGGSTQTPTGTSGNTFSVTGGEASVWGTHATAVPTTGTATYMVLGSTTPIYHTNASGTDSLGTLKSASLTVAFSTLKLGVSGVVNGGGNDYTFSSAGGTATPSITLNGTTFAGTGTASVTGGALTSGAPGTGTLNVFLAGPAASNAGLTYKLNATSNGSEYVSGAIAFGSPVTAAPTVQAPSGAGLQMRVVGKTFLPGTTTRSSEGTFISESATVTGSGDGKIDGGTWSGNAATRLTASNVDFGQAGGVIGWTRWAGGTLKQTTSSATFNEEVPTNGGMSQIWGAAVTNMPTTGTATYTMVGGTKPILGSGAAAPGSIVNAHFGVAFATLKAGFDAQLSIGSQTYNYTSVGGAASPSMAIDAKGSFTEFGSTAHITGFLAGAGAGFAGVSYFGIGATGAIGVIAFQKAP